MSSTRPSPLAKTEQPTAQIAKAALRRLAARAARAHARELRARVSPGSRRAAADSTEALATLIERIIRGIERSGHNWTPARRKEGIQRVLAGGRSDAKKLQQRLSQLVNSWESDSAATPVALGDAAVAACRRGRRRSTAARRARAPSWPKRARPPTRRPRRPWRRCKRRERGMGARRAHARPCAAAGAAGARRRQPGSRQGARQPGRSAWTARTLRRRLAADIEAPGAARRARAAAPPPPVRPARQALPRADREPDRPGRGRQLGQGPVRGDAAQDRRGPERARRPRGQRHAASRAQAPRRGARRAREGARRAQVADRRRCSPSSASSAPRPATSTRASAATPR